MSRRESDREDLLREATALVERIELSSTGFDEPIVAGFRRDGSASFFFGADPVYQFNSAGEFRRGYIGGLLYKAERGRLVSLRRARRATEVALLRSELGSDDALALLAAARGYLARLHEASTTNSFTIIGQVPSDADVIGRISNWLAELPPQIRVADAPNAR